MSIFPKKAIPGQAVTIHTSIKPLFDTKKILTPLVKVSVCDPEKNATLLLEKQVFLFSTAEQKPPFLTNEKPVGMKPTTPLLVLASYLEGKYARQQLANMLDQFSHATHFYAVFQLPQNAQAGKYTLQSEFILDGIRYPSSTQEEDFFLVEHLEILQVKAEKNGFSSLIKNTSRETVSARLIGIDSDGTVQYREMLVPSQTTTAIHFHHALNFLDYCDGQVCIPLLPNNQKLCVPNPEWLTINKFTPKGQLKWVMNGQESAFELDHEYAQLWEKARRMPFVSDYAELEAKLYQEMVKAGMLSEI